MNNPVSIFFSGDDSQDGAFAHTLAKAVRAYGTPRLFDVDELDRADLRGEKRSEWGKGTPIFVLSLSMLSKSHNRWKLLHAAPRLNLPGYVAFYICRGIKSSEIRASYPELEDLFNNVMIGDESDLPELLVELRQYVLQKEARVRFSWILFAQQLLTFVIVPLGLVCNGLYYASFLTPFVLCYLLIVPSVSDVSWELALSWLALYGLGFGISWMPALDFWPWLGRRWKLPDIHLSAELDRHISITRANNWLAEGSLALPEPEQAHPTSSSSELSQAIASWLTIARSARLLQILRMLVMSLPAAAVILGRPWQILGVSVIAFMFGALFPPLFYWASDLMRKTAYWNIGLTERELEYTDKFFGRRESVAPADTSVQAIRDRAQMEHWALLHSVLSFLVRRRWFPHPDNVFISYAWADQAGVSVAVQLGYVLEKLGVCFFLDRRNISAKFSAWRSIVSTALLDCTHFFVIVGPNILGGQVVRREIKTVVQRWNDELFPAAICIVEPDVAARLMTNASPYGIYDLPLELRFLLTWAPRLTYAEACDPELVGYLLQQRRRQGLVRDWWAALFPETVLAQGGL